MPIGNGETQMVLQSLAGNDFVGIVKTVGQRIGAVRAFIFDLGNIAEKAGSHMGLLPEKMMVMITQQTEVRKSEYDVRTSLQDKNRRRHSDLRF